MRKTMIVGCVILLFLMLFGCNKKAKEPNANEVSKYTYVSFHDYTNELSQEFPEEIHQELNNRTIRVETLDRVIFQGGITFEAEGNESENTVIIGGMPMGKYKQRGIGLYIKDNEVYALNHYSGDAQVIGTGELGKSINFSIRFDKKSDEKWELTYKVGDTSTKVTYSQDYYFGNYIYIVPTHASIRVCSSKQTNPVRNKKTVSYNLSKGDYLLTGNYVVLNAAGKEVKINDKEPIINKPGDYKILTKSGSFSDSQEVSLYIIGDVDLDGASGKSKDLEALQTLIKKVKADSETDSAAKYAADLNNDNRVNKTDLELMKKITSGTVTLDSVITKYYAPALTYDYLGGDEVMPIVGYYGPNGEMLTDEIFQLIKESGINIINTGETLNMDEDNNISFHKALGLAEKYGIGYFVVDDALNPERPKDVRDNAVRAQNIPGNDQGFSTAQIAELIEEYSFYESYLGTHVVDEPHPNVYKSGSNLEQFNLQIMFFDWIAKKLNSFANNIGFINLFGPSYYSGQGHSLKEEYTFLIQNANAKVLSYDYYPFAWTEGVTGKNTVSGYESYLDTYYTGLWYSREQSLNSNIPFWAYVEAGGDFRDDGSNAPTDPNLLPTEQETYWNVNNYLAFGAKGIEWFTLVQPGHFSSEGNGNDYDRTGLIGADGTTTPFYEYAKNINKHITAVDDVLMKSVSTGIMATGEFTIGNLQSGDSHAITTSTKGTKIDMLKKFSGGNSRKHGGILGCFDYGDTEAYYIVNDSVQQSQTFKLEFNDSYQYRYVMNAKEYSGSGSTFDVKIGPGEGVLVVLGE